MRSNQDAVAVEVRIRRQSQNVRTVLVGVLPCPAPENRLLLSQVMVEANVILVRIETARTVANVVGDAQLVWRAVVRQRIERQKSFRYRTDPVVRDTVVEKRLSRQRIAHGNGFDAEIAVAHGLRRYRVLNRLAARKSESLKRAEEEGLVAPLVKPGDARRAAAADAEVVADLLRFGHSAVGLGVKRAVLMEPECRGVIFIRPALRDGRHVTDLAVLSRIADALHLDLGDRFGRREGLGQRRVAADVRRRDAVERVLRL